MNYKVNETVRQLLRDSAEHITEAERYQQAIRDAELTRATFRLAQGELVAYVNRNKLYLQHPARYTSLRQFLEGAGLAASGVCELCALAEEIVPFCEGRGIDIDQVLTPDTWPKTREAIPALRRAARAQSVSRAEQIIDFVERADTRSTVRRALRRHRAPLGQGLTIEMDDGVVLAAVIPQQQLHDVLSRLDNVLELNNGVDLDWIKGMLTSAVQAL